MKPTAFEALRTNGGFLGGHGKRHHAFALAAPTVTAPKKAKGPKPAKATGDNGFETDDTSGAPDSDQADPFEATGGMNIAMPKAGKPALTINIHHPPMTSHQMGAMKKMQKPRFSGM